MMKGGEDGRGKGTKRERPRREIEERTRRV